MLMKTREGCTLCSRHQSNRFTLVPLVKSVLSSLKLVYIHGSLFLRPWTILLREFMNFLLGLPHQMLLDDRTNHLHQQRKADLFLRTSTFCDTSGKKVKKMNFTLKSHRSSTALIWRGKAAITSQKLCEIIYGFRHYQLASEWEAL